MRTILVGGALVLATTMNGQALWAQHEGHGQPATSEVREATDKTPAGAPKKDPNRPKPENQPGAVKNAEELAASHADHHEMVTFEGGGVLPDGWKSRFDLPGMKVEHIRFLANGASLHVTSGPPGIYYQPARTARGTYTVKATFTQLAKGEHREGYGPMIGGADLDGAGQRYLYFLLRQDGKYLIKQRDGVNTKGIADWTAHPAIKSFGPDGRMTNELAIAVGRDTVRFLINDTEVASRPRADVPTEGIVGLRVNHNLDIQVDGLAIEQLSPGAV